MRERAGRAPAKVNLALHVTGRRPDGYHLLDTLVAFPDVADVVRLSAGHGGPRLELDGPFASALAGEDPDGNLVVRAVRAVAAIAGVAPAVVLSLEKNLPVASGIGGGSSDAAAAIRLSAGHFGVDLRDPRIADAALALGADVPMCLAGVPLRARGVGEAVAPLPPLPPLGMVLSNPGVAVPTAAVFRRLAAVDNPPLPEPPGEIATADGLVAFLAAARNDLESPAREIAPAIGDVLDALLALPGARLARMSGSGATCFALFDDAGAADAAAAALLAERPGWWTVAAPLSSPG